MAGKQIGEYSLKSSSFRYSRDPPGTFIVEGNCEGTALGFGAVLGSATESAVRAGLLVIVQYAYLDNGVQLYPTGTGT